MLLTTLFLERLKQKNQWVKIDAILLNGTIINMNTCEFPSFFFLLLLFVRYSYSQVHTYRMTWKMKNIYIYIYICSGLTNSTLNIITYIRIVKNYTFILVNPRKFFILLIVKGIYSNYSLKKNCIII
jgi:hypothetical protein